MNGAGQRVRIFDTTLRDGEQSPGVSLRLEEKLEIARQLQKLGVDIIEAGFPIASVGEIEAVQAIARTVRGPVIAALARTRVGDIDAAWDAVHAAESARIHTFTSGSPVHLRHMLRISEDENVEMAIAAVRRARTYVSDVEFSAQDVARADPEYLVRLYGAAIEAGATTINIPDTVGYSTPTEFAALIALLRGRLGVGPDVTISVHTHDDLGLAVANALAGVEAGARQVECAINGIGERAGNCALEEVVMALVTRSDHYRMEVGIRTEELCRTSVLVSRLTGMPVQPNKAVVGANAFAHEAGIHQDGVLKERTTYEIMRPQDVGVPETRLVLGKHSGRHALRERFEAMGYQLADAEFLRAFERFKSLADRKKGITDADLEAIVHAEVVGAAPERYRLQYFQVTSGNNTIPTATVRIEVSTGEELQASETGDGPVDAVYRAIDRAVGEVHMLADYSLKAVTEGQDAAGQVTVRLQDGEGRSVVAHGVSTDVIEASARGYVAALNKLAVQTGQTVVATEH